MSFYNPRSHFQAGIISISISPADILPFSLNVIIRNLRLSGGSLHQYRGTIIRKTEINTEETPLPDSRSASIIS